jgi:hypothetical protein
MRRYCLCVCLFRRVALLRLGAWGRGIFFAQRNFIYKVLSDSPALPGSESERDLQLGSELAD